MILRISIPIYRLEVHRRSVNVCDLKHAKQCCQFFVALSAKSAHKANGQERARTLGRLCELYIIFKYLLGLIMGKYKRKTERKLVFTEENLREARRRIENGESQRQVALSMGTKESTLRKRLKSVRIKIKEIQKYNVIYS